MKKTMYVFAAVMMIQCLTACGSVTQESKTEDIFRPTLDTSGKCHINVTGGYDNFASTYKELVSVCREFRKKGYENPMMGYTAQEKTSLYTLISYPLFCSTVANDAEAVKKTE